MASKDVNAWCMPGGKIAVYTGLLDKVHPTDDELAAVIGHEIAHALREHGRGAWWRRPWRCHHGMVTPAWERARYRRRPGLHAGEMEQEADRIGVELAARAGYEPHAAITLWEKMRRVSDGESPQWLSTHPSHVTRIADLRTYADRVASTGGGISSSAMVASGGASA